MPIAAVALAIAGALGLAPPPRQAEPPVLSVSTDLVTLPVTVVDRRGAFVSGLRAEHFTVYDNGQPQHIQFFTDEDLPATVGLVIDSSASMRARRPDVAVAAAAFAAMSHPLAEFFIVNFNERAWLGLPPGLPFTDSAAQLHAALISTPMQGMTALYDGVSLALDHLARGTRDRKALIVVSDGGDNASMLSRSSLLDRARQSNAIVYAVILRDLDDNRARPGDLRMLARETGAHAFEPDGAREVSQAFTQIAREIRSAYMLGYPPPDVPDGYRSVRVVVETGDGRQLIARTKAGYYARSRDDRQR
jgi:Ca-activated chloride channel family protein